MSKQKIAFFSRAKPQKCDAFEVFERAKMVFIGYPILKKGKEYDPNNLEKCLVNYNCSDEEWEKHCLSLNKKGAYTKHRNLVKSVGVGSIVIIPRPAQGMVYLGRISDEFQITSEYGRDYLNLRGASEEEDLKHMHRADVAQGWPVEKYKPIPIFRIPSWIRRSLFARSSFHVFGNHPQKGNDSAFEVLEFLLENDEAKIELPWAEDLEEVKKRLVDTMLPNSFENLIVSLLQLENPEQIWHQVGGVGDGGVDGIGLDASGAKTIGIMQAKLSANKFPRRPALEDGVKFYSAVLYGCGSPKEAGQTNTEYLDMDWISHKVLKHADRLPQAIAMRIGKKE